MKDSSSSKVRKIFSGVFIALGVLTFFLAQSTLWVSQTFFNEDNFVGTVQEVLATEESRQAISNTIVDAVFQNNPVAEQLIGKQVGALTTGILGSDIANRLLDNVAHRSYAYLTSSDRQDIAINIAPIKDTLVAIVNIAENNGREVKFDPSIMRNSIVLVESDALPDISGYIRMLLLAGGALWVATFASFTAYIYINRKRPVHSIYVVGWSIIIVSFLALMVGPFAPSAIASFINVIAIRGVVEDLTRAFVTPFQVQLLSGMVIAALTMLIVSLRGAIKTGVIKLVALFK